MNNEKVYQFNEYVLGYDKGLKDRSCLTISKIQNGNMYVMSSLYDGSADVISTLLDNLQQENEKKDAYIKYLEEYNPKYYKGKKFYGDSREQLQQRIDKAINHIIVKQIRMINEDNYNINHSDLEEISDILKGDSDE